MVASRTSRRCIAWLWWSAALWTAPGMAAPPPRTPEVTVTVRADFGEDLGQALGTLFEAVDATDRTVAGAGFVSAYNTQDRSDRRLLQAFVRVPRSEAFSPQSLPRPSRDAGTYLFGYRNRLFAYGRGGADGRLRVWDGQEWRADDATVPLSVEVGDGALSFTQRAIRFDDAELVAATELGEGLAEPYYAAGHLVWRHYNATVEPPINELAAAPWRPGAEIDRSSPATHALGTPREFIYCYGQLGDRVLAASNTGGVFLLQAGRWHTVRPTDPRVSFQIYSSLNYFDRLLLGQYPSGEIWELTGLELQQRRGWPGVMPGVRSAAREAQTLALYGGELYAGVWPWGEVWRLDPHDERWKLLGRMFSHPRPTDAATHPYENETKSLDPVLNRWGQRVTSLTPWGDSLYIATSAKGPNAYEDKFNFMTRQQADEYGAVYRYRVPGCITVPFRWKSGATTFAFRWTSRGLTVLQDGDVLGQTDWPAVDRPQSITPVSVNGGAGLFGASPAKCRAELSVKSRPMPLSAYVKLDDVCDASLPQAEREAQLDAMLDRFAASGLNTVMPYANTSSGKTYYPSGVASRHVFGDWDAMGYFTAAARNRGLEVWPAVCCMVCGGEQPAGVLADHPDWALRQTTGQPWGYFSPAHPQARNWLVSLVGELVDRYEPDGVLLDYLRYHNRPHLLDPAAQAQLDAELAALPDETARAAHRQAVREGHLTDCMEVIAQRVRQLRPDTQLGLYTWGPHVSQNHLVGQAWPEWVRRGWLDLVNVSGYYYAVQDGRPSPMWRERYIKQLRDAVSLAGGDARQATVTFTLGVKTSHGQLASAAEIDDYLQTAAATGVDGVGVFTWSSLAPFLEDFLAADSLPRFVEAMENRPRP